MSPRSIPSFAAVAGCSSTHELHSTFVTGSGSSWSQGLFAPRPSPRVGEGYVTRKKSPVAAGAAALVVLELVVALDSRFTMEPAPMPLRNVEALFAALPWL